MRFFRQTQPARDIPELNRARQLSQQLRPDIRFSKQFLFHSFQFLAPSSGLPVVSVAGGV